MFLFLHIWCFWKSVNDLSTNTSLFFFFPICFVLTFNGAFFWVQTKSEKKITFFCNPNASMSAVSPQRKPPSLASLSQLLSHSCYQGSPRTPPPPTASAICTATTQSAAVLSICTCVSRFVHLAIIFRSLSLTFFYQMQTKWTVGLHGWGVHPPGTPGHTKRYTVHERGFLYFKATFF